MMNCPGGDANGCMMPDTCMPTKGGPLDANGLECPVVCPMNCGKDMMSCPGGDDGNGCMMPDTCMPTKGGPLDNDGNECPIQCPMNCGKDMMSCPGGDANGCMMPDTCMPTKEEETAVDEIPES